MSMNTNLHGRILHTKLPKSSGLFKEEIREELDYIKGIMKEGFTHREKCELLFDIIDGKSRIELNVKIAEFVTKNKEPKASNAA